MKASPSFLLASLALSLSSSSKVSAKDSGAWIKSSLTTSPHSNYYGVSCSLSSRLLAVGAPYDTPTSTGEDAGTAHILSRDDNGKLTLVKEIMGDEFDQLGESVAVSKGVNSGGTTMEVVVVGSPRHSTKEGKMNIGMARVFYFSEFHSEWQQLGQDIVGKWDEEFFGQTVAISDDGMMVAVATSVGDEARRGRVELYHYNDVGNIWEMMGFPLEGENEGAKFGSSVSIAQVSFNSGAEKYYIAIGAPQVNKGRGIVQVYHWDEDLGDWSQVGRDLEGDESQDQLGYDVSMAMNGAHLYLAIGIPSAIYYGGDEGQSDSRVQVYKYNTDLDGKTEWIYFGDEIEQFEDGDGTGEVVELSQDGMILAIGSPEHDDGKGMVRVFEFNWDYGDYVRVGDVLYGNEGDGFGTSMSIFGTDIAVGAPFGGYVQVFSFDPKGGNGIGSTKQEQANKNKSGFGKFISTTVILGVVGFLMFAVHKNLKRKGFRWSSMTAALPGASRFRRRGREVVSTDDNTGRDEWPFPFFSASDRARIEQVRKAEEGRAGEDVDDVDSVVLHGMRRKTGSSHDAESAESSSGSDDDSDVSYDSKTETVQMRQIT